MSDMSREFEYISKMEEIFDEITAAQDSLKRTIDEYKSLQDKVRRLEEYYTSDQWKEDLAMDEHGEIPADIKRGVLSEDGIYDLLDRNNEIMRMIETDEDQSASGFRKDDKLIPIITAVVYLGSDPWDGPRSLFEMLDVKDDRMYAFLNDYKINIIAPGEIADTDFDKFNTGLGLAMNVLKHQKDYADKIIGQTNHKKVDIDTAIFLNRVAKLGLEFDETEDSVDMCVAMENRMKKEQIIGAIEMGRELGTPDEELFYRVAKKYDIKIEEIKKILDELVCN